MTTDLYYCPRMNARMLESACESNRKWLTWKPTGKPSTSRGRKLIRGRSGGMTSLQRLDVQTDRSIYCVGCPGVRAIAEQGLDVLADWAVDKPTEWREDPKRFCPRGLHLRIAWWSISDGCRACNAERRSRTTRARSDRAKRDNPRRKRGEVDLDPIASAIAERHRLQLEHLLARTRAQPVFAARAEAMRACREAGATIAQIGLYFRRHPSTVLNALGQGG